MPNAMKGTNDFAMKEMNGRIVCGLIGIMQGWNGKKRIPMNLIRCNRQLSTITPLTKVSPATWPGFSYFAPL